MIDLILWWRGSYLQSKIFISDLPSSLWTKGIGANCLITTVSRSPSDSLRLLPDGEGHTLMSEYDLWVFSLFRVEELSCMSLISLVPYRRHFVSILPLYLHLPNYCPKTSLRSTNQNPLNHLKKLTCKEVKEKQESW